MDFSIKGSSLKSLWDSSPFAGANAPYLESLYESYLQDPNSVSENWQVFFRSLAPEAGVSSISHDAVRDSFRELAKVKRAAGGSAQWSDHDARQVRVLQMINAYRFRGHLWANTNPLQDRGDEIDPEMEPEFYDLSSTDLDTVFNTGSLVGPEAASLREIIDTLRSTYCGSIGSEYMHITDTDEKRWIQQFIESRRGRPHFSPEIKRQLLHQMIAAEGLEKFLHTKYVGQKRFSLEGGESMIPILKGLIQRGGDKYHLKEIAIGMAHRGRLNVLVNVMGKMPSELYLEFEGKVENGLGTGDVKYHMGFSSDFRIGEHTVHVVLAFNPSHLEIVGPVVEGSVRARQDRRTDQDGKEVMPILIHGDASFAGQGVVMETFNMSQSRGYATKGTIHIVVNNQIGFTTSNQEDARSTMYCTDVAKMVGAPIFHVNGDDPEAVLLVAQLALDYRMMFGKDIVIDLVCYRRHGHNEADEPAVTQPMMYRHIRTMPTTMEKYVQQLITDGLINHGEVKQHVIDYRNALNEGNTIVDSFVPTEHAIYPYAVDWQRYLKRDFLSPVDTRVDRETLSRLYSQLSKLPAKFKLHPKTQKIMDDRKKMVAGELAIDWGFAETMAYASLLNEGYSVRLSGQDCGRGTFFHRHAVLLDQNTGTTHVPLRSLNTDKNRFLVINSLLSEEAVLAFEYGYATTDPNTLTIWEAQFGDFANGAQVVVDQFISAGEQKWNRLCGLVMLLPHGFEGQGPEHSSARLERYLQLCAQHNMRVCVPSNAAQIFHLLRRQMLMDCRRPLIVMSPKSLLRLPQASSDVNELIKGRFRTVIGEVDELDDDEVTRIVLCSGKVFYDLLEKRREQNLRNVAIIRIEQLYPFPDKAAVKQLSRYPNATEFIWCQEEPKNQGAWYSSQHHMRAAIGKGNYLDYAGRPLHAAPAVGYFPLHVRQQKELVEQALGIRSEE